MSDENEKLKLPENAFKELQPGEKYIPVVKDSTGWPQFSVYSLIFGFLALILFTGASVFLGVKIAQIPEAGMSVCLLAMVLTVLLRWKKVLLQNVIVQCIASAATGVACLIFVLPAIYIIGLPDVSFLMKSIPVVIGATFAILFTIVVRKYYMIDMHGKLPFPEAKAATNTLVAGAGSGVKYIGLGLIFGGVIDLLNNYFGAFKSTFSTSVLPLFDKIAAKTKLVLEYDVSAAVFGMGYLIGLRYALIICATSIAAYWLLVPFFAMTFDTQWLLAILPASLFHDKHGQLIDFAKETTTAKDIFLTFVRPIGIGTFFTAGLLSIIFQRKTIINSVMSITKQIKVNKAEKVEENSRDLSALWLITLFALTLAVLFGFLIYVFNMNWWLALLMFVIITIMMVMFIPAAIMATATVGNAPVSGMTLVCLVTTCLIIYVAGLSGDNGKMVAVLLGTFMCVTLAFASSYVTDLKIGYWLGATPAKQEGIKIVAVIVSTVVAVFCLKVVNDVYGFVLVKGVHDNPVAAPQANAMAGVINTILSGGQVPWLLYGLGAMIALVMQLKFHISAIVIALGFYIPMEYNTPILAGALVAHFVSKPRGDETQEITTNRYDRGMTVATGLVAGGSIAGILSAMLTYFEFGPEKAGNWVSLLVIAISVIFLYTISIKEEKTK